jgi:hypothetical protein
VQFKPQELSNTAWTFATLNISNQKLFNAIAEKAASSIVQLKPQELSNTAWAFAFADPSQIARYLSKDSLQSFDDPRDWLQAYQALVVAGLVSPSEHYGRLEEIQNSYQKAPANSFENDVEK